MNKAALTAFALTLVQGGGRSHRYRKQGTAARTSEAERAGLAAQLHW
jgi:hypothetical protein